MDILSYILGKKAGGGGGEAVLINKDISANGTYNASADSADGYKKVTVDVPNSYAAGDEGKVVSNGALVAQGSATYTSNGTYDTTLVNEVEVDVPATSMDFLNTAEPTGTITSNATIVKDSAAYGRTGITGVSSNTVQKIYKNAFNGCTALQSVSFPNCIGIGGDHSGSTSHSGMFRDCYNLTSVSFPNATWMHGQTFYTCSSLPVAVFPKCALVGNQAFYGCSALAALDFGGATFSTTGNSVFEKCTVLKTLIIRASSVASLGNANHFKDTPFASGGTGGDIYIPKSLYDHLGDGTANDYKAATNWSTYDGYGTITWHAIEGSIYETQYADGTPIT